MSIGISEALKALPLDIPIGCIITDQRFEIVSQAHNQREANCSISAHAEILAMEQLSKQNQNWRLNNYILFTTLEPCLMCTGAITQSRISTVVFGASQQNSYSHVLQQNGIQVIGGILEVECQKLLYDFFQIQRHHNTKSL